MLFCHFERIPFGKLRSRYRGVIAFKWKEKHRAKRKRRQQRTINRIQTQFRLKSMMILIFVFLIIFNAQNGNGNGIFKTFSQNQLNQCLKTFSLDSSNKRIKPLVLNESILETCHAAENVISSIVVVLCAIFVFSNGILTKITNLKANFSAVSYSSRSSFAFSCAVFTWKL